MTNIAKKIEQKKAQKDTQKSGSQLSFFEPVFEARKAPALDKLAQLPHFIPETAKSAQFDGFGKLSESGQNKLKKRARAKYLTSGFTNRLRHLESPLKQSYVNTHFCASTLLQSGQRITSTYCGNRWCLVCNRIRTAKLINAYRPVLDSLPDKQHVVLTIPNVQGGPGGSVLRSAIMEMTKQIGRIQNNVFAKRGTLMDAIRKTEVTYNPNTGLYHPHNHLILSGAQVADDLVLEWLKRFPEARRVAQKIRPADDDSVMELFKYFTKLLTDKEFYPGAQDLIFQAMRGLRAVQTMGRIKAVDIPEEDIEEIQAETYWDIQAAETQWQWHRSDWIDESTGEVLADYTPSKNFEEFVNRLYYEGKKTPLAKS